MAFLAPYRLISIYPVELVFFVFLISDVTFAGCHDNLPEYGYSYSKTHGIKHTDQERRLWVRSSDVEGSDTEEKEQKTGSNPEEKEPKQGSNPEEKEPKLGSDTEEGEPKLPFEPGGDEFYSEPVALASDPSDKKLSQGLWINGVELNKDNPCQWYNEGSSSGPNKKRIKHCRDAVENFNRAGFKTGDSKLCPEIDGADCFQFINHIQSGRCYAKVTTSDTKAYILFSNCVRDWKRAKKITDGTPLPTATDGSDKPGTPEPREPEPDIIPDGDDMLRQPVEEPDDPSDEVLNQELKANSVVIQYINPCIDYIHGSHSWENRDSKKFCRKAVDHLYKAGFKDNTSKLCPIIEGADCFQFKDHKKDGRCYAKVRTMPPDSGLSYVLLYKCVKDWQKATNITEDAPIDKNPECKEPCLLPEGDGNYAQPKVLKTDPPDDKINRRLKVKDVIIWDANPCRWYNHHSKSNPNIDRRNYCRMSMESLRKAGFKDGDSKLCPTLDGTDCFQFRDHAKSGRCYVKVTTRPPDNGKVYILINNCVRDWMRSKNITSGTVWPTGVGDDSKHID